METLDAISGRRVIRAFAKQPVSPDLLEKIVNAGRHAMSARNLQPWQFIVIRNPDRLRELGAVMHDRSFRGRRAISHRGAQGYFERTMGRC